MNRTLCLLFRGVFVLWLGLALMCGLFVTWKTTAPSGSALLTFLFTREVPEAEPVLTTVPMKPTTAEAPPPPPPPLPEVTATKADVAYPLMERSKRAGQGKFGTPEVRVLDDGAVEVRLPYTGTTGGMSMFREPARGFCAVDIHGSWKGLVSHNVRVKGDVAPLVQFGDHRQFIRVTASGVANSTLKEETRTSPTQIIIRFTREQ